MPTESEYGDDIQLLDDLTRLKLRLIDKVREDNQTETKLFLTTVISRYQETNY